MSHLYIFSAIACQLLIAGITSSPCFGIKDCKLVHFNLSLFTSNSFLTALSFNRIQAFVISSTIFHSALLLIPGVSTSIFSVSCIPAGIWQVAANMSAQRFLKIMADCLTQHAITNQKLSSHNPENRCTCGAEIITRRWKTKLPELSGGECSNFF